MRYNSPSLTCPSGAFLKQKRRLKMDNIEEYLGYLDEYFHKRYGSIKGDTYIEGVLDGIETALLNIRNYIDCLKQGESSPPPIKLLVEEE